MWFFSNKSFLSIVADRNDPKNLLVRSRRADHIEALFPQAEVFQDVGSDYLFRCILPKKTVAKILAAEILKIDYDNFKNSVGSGNYSGLSGLTNPL